MGAQHGGPVVRGQVFEPPGAADPTLLSGHRISARLGDGALGRVFFAHAPDGRPVALTVVRPELAALPGFATRFHHDGLAAQRVRGPYTVPVTGSGADGGRYWFASGYVPALSLHAAVAAAGPLPVGGVLRLVAGIAEALAAMNRAGVVHGDLRPANVLLAADGPRVKDYGIARAADAELLTGRPEADGTGEGEAEAEAEGAEGAAGSEGAPAGRAPVLRSPEQAAGRPGGPATDVFALGQIAAYAATGIAPFGDGPAQAVLARVAQEEADLSELPGQLREIVTRCLIKDPALRPSPAQIIAMCGQAAPESVRPRLDPWLPPALLAALVPPMPPPAPPAPAAPPPPAQPPGHGWPAPHWHTGWTRPVHMHLPRPLPLRPLPLPLHRPGGRGRRRMAVLVGALAALAVVITAGVALAGGFDGSSAKGGPARAAGAAPSTAPGHGTPPRDDGRVPTTVPGGGSAPTTVPGGAVPGVPTAPGGGDGNATGAPEPQGTIYRGVQLPAGYALVLAQDPLQLLQGPAAGNLGYSVQPDVFTTDPHAGTLALLEPGAPGTLAACRAATHPMPTIARDRLNAGSRLCVQSMDGTAALVTFRQLTAQGEPDPRVILDITVWRGLQVADRSAAGQGP
ncbi:serine/threonine-protein kinase [Streptomyces sp. CA-111067]|uniref:serine/threonine-protein kinase n=1 Tax=Streptomyces sp. CA-111067 TaxID=3240046 RepID=UPI003D95E6FE